MRCPKCGAPAGPSAPDGDFRYQPPLQKRSPAAEIAREIIEIMGTRDRQEAEHTYGTPGGLEHIGDVWRLLDQWRRRLTPPRRTGENR